MLSVLSVPRAGLLDQGLREVSPQSNLAEKKRANLDGEMNSWFLARFCLKRFRTTRVGLPQRNLLSGAPVDAFQDLVLGHSQPFLALA